MSEPVPFQSSFFTVDREGDVYVLSIIKEQLVDVDNLEQLSQDFNLLIEKHEITKIILRLTGVRYMTSMAIGKLITLHRKLNRIKGALVLCELMPDVSATMDAAKLLTYFTTCPDLTSAMAMIQTGA
jgi:anti-sigma B factor antagonist